MRTIDIQDTEIHFHSLIEAIEAGADDEIVIERNGRPIARLISTRPVLSERRLGVARGMFVVPGLIDEDGAMIAELFSRTAK
jgi:antitoxin (DNA-binding transcriptional repressor) of toxin-antitoxin stability system